jgi:DNA-binding beta-propeller fold protein YncE
MVVRRKLLLATPVLGLVFRIQAGVAFAESPTKAFVLDSGAHALVALELPSGKRVGALALSGAPSALVQSPDGSRLVVLDRGPGEDKREHGYKAAGKSSATIVDSTELKSIARVELGSGVEPGAAYFSPDGRRLTVLCPGYEAKNPAEAQPRELVNLDLVDGRETGRLALEPGAVPIVASKDGQTLPVIQGLPRGDKYPYAKSRLFVVDLAGPTLRATLDTGGWTDLYTDGVHFYLLDPGKPDKDPQKNRDGTLQVASLADGALAPSLGAGRAPRGLYQDEAGAQVFLPSDGPPGATEGELRVIRGGAVAATLKVASHPKLVLRQGNSVYVVGERAVTVVDPAALQVTASIALARGGEALVDDDDVPTELKLSSDGKRACIHYGVAHKVAVLDLEAKQAIGSTKTGSGGKKLFGNMMGGMFGMAGLLAAGYSPWIYTEPRMLAVRSDGRFAYAINSQTKDVTVVDTTTGKSQGTIGGGGYALELLNGGQLLYEVSGSELRLIDLDKNAKAGEIPLDDLRGLFFPQDRSVAVALAKQTVVVLDGATGKELARPIGFVSPDAIVFHGAR